MPDPIRPLSVIHRLAKVMEELPSIGRGNRASAQQGGYQYRGIEDMTAVIQPLLAKHQVVFVPNVESCEIKDIEVNGKPWTDTIMTVRYRVYGVDPDDWIELTVIGIGRDNSDKGANKALTQAFKYALIQTLCISDKRDDGDNQTHEADARPVGNHIGEKADKMAGLVEILEGMPEDMREACRTHLRQTFGPPRDMSLDQIDEAIKIAAGWS